MPRFGQTEEPSPDQAEVVRRIIKDLDELLDIQWFPTVRYSEVNDEFEGRYALTCRWPQSDPRWEMYQRGEISEPFDIMAYFEEDGDQMSWFAHARPITDPSQVIDRVIDLLASCDNEKQPWKSRVKDAFMHNAALQEARRLEAKAEVMDEFEYREGKIRGIPQSAVPAQLIDNTSPKE